MAYITTERIDPARLIEAVKSPSSGAIVTFSGTIRNNSGGREVIRLEYEANIPLAERLFDKIKNEAVRKFPIDNVSIQHRIGLHEMGEISVFIAVSSPHREEGFSACRFIIDRIKEIVPIWKKEHFNDGTEWAKGNPVKL